jgi:hypothetical protein
MDSRRAQSAFALFALSAMLASSAVAAAPDAGPISDAQFQKIVALIPKQHQKPADVEPKVAAALGLADGGKAAVVGRFAVTDKHGARYQISALSDDKGYLLIWHGGADARIFMMDANRALVSGLTVESNQYPSIMPQDDAQKLFAQDLAAWAGFVDSGSLVKNRPTKK